jgi:hypothetical protein
VLNLSLGIGGIVELHIVPCWMHFVHTQSHIHVASEIMPVDVAWVQTDPILTSNPKPKNPIILKKTISV